jgi:hypothetical protein
MDLTESIAPKSDQLNADDLISGPVTVTIREVAKGTAEQPVDVHLVEFPGRAYRPSKSMRRVMVTAWGSEASTYAGHRLTLFRNPEITFGRDKVGGIEVSHLSHIYKPLTIALTATRGKRKSFTVQPLAELVTCEVDDISTDAFDLDAAIAACDGDKAQLRSLYGKVQGMKAPQEFLNKIRDAATVPSQADETPAP